MISEPDPTTRLTDLQEAMQPWTTPDLMTYLEAIGVMFAEVETYAVDQPDGTPGWAVMLDVDKCPTAGLPYLGQWVGVRIPDGLADADQRQWIRDNSRQTRGTPTAIATATQRWLTGTAVVQINERTRGDGTTNYDYISISVFASQCPNPQQVLAELRKAVPADVQFDFATMTEETWLSVKTQYTTWAAVKSANATWAAVQGRMQGWLSWEQPS